MFALFHACHRAQDMLFDSESAMTFMHVIGTESMRYNVALQMTLVGHEWAISLDHSLPPKALEYLRRIRLGQGIPRILLTPVLHTLLSQVTHLTVPCYNRLNHGLSQIQLIFNEFKFDMVVLEIMETLEPSERTELENWVCGVRQRDPPYSYANGFVQRWEEEQRSGESFGDRAARYTSELESGVAL